MSITNRLYQLGWRGYRADSEAQGDGILHNALPMVKT